MSTTMHTEKVTHSQYGIAHVPPAPALEWMSGALGDGDGNCIGTVELFGVVAWHSDDGKLISLSAELPVSTIDSEQRVRLKKHPCGPLNFAIESGPS